MSTIKRSAINILTLHAPSLFSSVRPPGTILKNYTQCKKRRLKSNCPCEEHKIWGGFIFRNWSHIFLQPSCGSQQKRDHSFCIWFLSTRSNFRLISESQRRYLQHPHWAFLIFYTTPRLHNRLIMKELQQRWNYQSFFPYLQT